MGFSGLNSTCPSITTGPQDGTEHVAGSLTFHDLTKILCTALTMVVFIISGIHFITHATHFSNPTEQVKILRIIALIPVYAFVYLVAGIVPSAAIYVQPWADFYESIALSSYFMLLIAYVAPKPELQDRFFDKLKNKKGESSLKWYRRTWILVFQYIPLSFLTAVVIDITQAIGKYCANGNSLDYAHIWITIIQSISISLAVIRLLSFYKRLRSEVLEHKVFAKFVAIKGIVFITFFQDIVFTILETTGALKPSTKLSYDDIYYGLPSILICGEMVLFALFQFYAYSAKPYFINHGFSPIEFQKPAGQRYSGGPLGAKALSMALNPLDVLGGIATALKFVVSNPEVKRHDTGTAMEPLRPPQHENLPPPYSATGSRGLQRAHSPDSVEYGSPDRYTPVPPTHY